MYLRIRGMWEGDVPLHARAQSDADVARRIYELQRRSYSMDDTNA